MFAQCAEERENVVGDVARLEVLEPRPPHIRVGAAALVSTLREHAAFHGNAKGFRLALFERMQIIEPFYEQEVGNLLDYRARIRYTTGPEGIPDLIDLIANFTGEHC
jgi:hypothetical protein